MDVMKHKNESIEVKKGIDELFSIIKEIGGKIGRLDEINDLEKFIVIDTKLKLLPPDTMNMVTMKVSLDEIDQEKTKITFFAASFDGTIGFKSPQRAIDMFMEEFENYSS